MEQRKLKYHELLVSSNNRSWISRKGEEVESYIFFNLNIKYNLDVKRQYQRGFNTGDGIPYPLFGRICDSLDLSGRNRRLWPPRTVFPVYPHCTYSLYRARYANPDYEDEHYWIPEPVEILSFTHLRTVRKNVLSPFSVWKRHLVFFLEFQRCFCCKMSVNIYQTTWSSVTKYISFWEI
jgi:hypothetical protein